MAIVCFAFGASEVESWENQHGAAAPGGRGADGVDAMA
jgi:hypothetical protein